MGFILFQLKNMIAALCSSSRSGSKTKSFIKDDVTFGWDAIEAVYSKDITRAEQGLARLVPGLKYSYVYRETTGHGSTYDQQR